MFARLALSAATYPIDKPYDYAVPADLEAAIEVGMRVMVPFGNGNRISEGVVLSLTEESSYPNCKEVLRIVDSVPLLSSEQLQLAYFMRDRYFCTVYQAIRTMLPAGLWLNKSGVPRGKDRFREMVRLSVTVDEANQIIESRNRSAPKQAELLELLSTFEALPVRDLLHFTAASRASLLRLEQQGLIERYALEVYRRPETASVQRTELPVLNREQNEVLKSILAQNAVLPEPAVHLISGVTGSGKTCIYGHLIEHCLGEGKSAILLVPEIALTPQILAQFNSWFGEVVALLHSSLSVGERYDEWKRIKRGEARLVIGTRSAVFAPVTNLGLVIMDEEQEDSYRSESSPRYHKKEVARYRCHQSHY
ncbi:MAG: DEAD/DEAH box helicase [Oscillospiraceae bacterium]|nr:DEAD/DEAH box helicase [Oscillospiraceae bacterium]